MKRYALSLALGTAFALAAVLPGFATKPPPGDPTTQPSNTPHPTHTAQPSHTPKPTDTLEPTATQVPDTATPEPKKVYVCKYTGKPGVDEVLQTGQNPIEVSVNAIPMDPVVVGSYFADAQGRSYVLGFVPMTPGPSAEDCPEGLIFTETPIFTATVNITEVPTATPTETDTASTTPSDTPSATEVEPTATPSETAVVTQTSSPTDEPTATPVDTDTPTPVPTEPQPTPTLNPCDIETGRGCDQTPTPRPTEEKQCSWELVAEYVVLLDEDAPIRYWGRGDLNGLCLVKVPLGMANPAVSVERQAALCSLCATNNDPAYIYKADRELGLVQVWKNCKGELRYTGRYAAYLYAENPVKPPCLGACQ